jgi:hypothetical protein
MELDDARARTRTHLHGRTVAVRAMALGVCFALVGCGAPVDGHGESIEQVPVAAGSGVDAPSAPLDAGTSGGVTSLAGAATATAHATRVAPPTTTPRADPVQYVNSLDYGSGEMAPAMEAFRVVALARSWTPAAVDLWAPFVFDVIEKESSGCPNTRGGDVFATGSCTELLVHGRRPDSGFGQVTPVLYGPGGLVCQQEGLCSQSQIIETAWSSMVALVATLEALGRFPWCDYDGAGLLHRCDLIPRDARPKG